MAGEYITKVIPDKFLDNVEDGGGYGRFHRAVDVDKDFERFAASEFAEANALSSRDITEARGRFFLFVAESVAMPLALRQEMKIVANRVASCIDTQDHKGIYTLLSPLVSLRRSENGQRIEKRGNKLAMLAQTYLKTKPR
jgi:hypothetical protein